MPKKGQVSDTTELVPESSAPKLYILIVANGNNLI